MATSAGEVQVTLTTVTSTFASGLDTARSKLQSFGNFANDIAVSTGLATAIGFGGIVVAIKKSLDAYAQQTLATATLAQALSNQGIAVDETVARLNEFSESLQRATGVSVTTITQAQALMTTFGLQGAQMDRTTKAALDMSAALGIDLVTSAKLLGKAFDGNYGMLARYGIIIDKSIEPSKQFDAILRQLEQRFGGTAIAQAETYGGQIKKLGSNFEELEKAVGKLITTGGTGGFVGWMNKAVSAETEFISQINSGTKNLGGFDNVMRGVILEVLRIFIDAMTQLIGLMLKALSHLPLMGTAMKSLQTDLNGVNKSLNAQVDAWEKSTLRATESGNKQIAVVAKIKAAHADYLMSRQQMEQNIAAWQTDRTLQDYTQFQDSLKAKQSGYDKFAAAFELTTDNMWLAAGKSAKQVSDAFAKGMAEVIIKGKDFHDMMISIWQDIEMQVIEYIIKLIAKELILLALEAATGTLGLAHGGGTAAAPSVFEGFMAEGGVISEPSIITGMRSGTSRIAGESGPEMVTPMTGPNAGGGGGSVTINISGQFLEGNTASWRRMVNEQIIPAIRRYSMINPTGPFNRTRGVV